MKKTSLLIMALAMVLGLTQCRKPVTPGGGGQAEGVQSISFTAESNNDKGVFIENGTASRTLNYRWAANDQLHVYGSKNGTFSDGEHLGVVTTNESGYSVTFYGDLDMTGYTEGVSKLRFYHFGSGVDVNNGVATSDISEQDGSKTGSITSKVVAYTDDKPYVRNNGYASTMKVKFAVVKFDLTKYAGAGTVTMTSSSGNVINVDAKGVMTTTSVSGGACTLSSLGSSPTKYCVMVLPGDNVKLSFAGNGKTYSVTKTFLQDHFYYNADNPENGVAVPVDVFFSVSPTKRVQFSKGALYYDGSNWGFTDNQWEFYTYYDGPYCAGNKYHSSGSPRIGTFAWSMSSNNYGISVDCSAYVSGDGAFIDWGSRVGSGWFTLSKDEMKYLIDRRTTDNQKYYGHYHFAAVDENCHVAGFVFLPDGTPNPKTILDNMDRFNFESFTSDLEKYNAVFLPSAGRRWSNSGCPESSIGGYFTEGTANYWLRDTEYSSKGGYLPIYYYDEGGATDPGFRTINYSCGQAVRLVRELQ